MLTMQHKGKATDTSATKITTVLH